MTCAILERSSGFEPSYEKIAPRYLKLVMVPNFCPFTMISLWMLLVLSSVWSSQHCLLKKNQFSYLSQSYFFTIILIMLYYIYPKQRSGGGVVDNTLDYQSRGLKINPRFSGLSDETLNRGPVSV